jgi:hypothetical protein
LDKLYSTSIATGTRVLTLSSINPFLDISLLSQLLVTPLIRKQGCSQEDTLRLNKQLQVDTGTSNRIVQIVLVIRANIQSWESRLQETLDLLFKVYTSQLLQADLDKAIDLIDNKRKALFFVRLLQGDVCNCWLERYTDIQVIVQGND